MKKLLILLVCQFFIPKIFAQFITPLNDHATIDFTDTVELKKEHDKTYFFALLDVNGKRMEVANVVSLSKLYSDTAFFKDAYNDSMVSSLLLHNLPNQMEGMKVISKKKFVTDKLHGIDLTYKVVKTGSELPFNYLYLRGVLAGHDLYYLFVFLYDTDDKSLKIKNHFLNSLKVN